MSTLPIKRVLFASILFLFCISHGEAWAQFTSQNSGDFLDPNTWDAPPVFDGTETFTIANGDVVTVNASIQVAGLDIVEGSLEVGTGGTMDINGDLTLATDGFLNITAPTGALNIGGNVTNSGTFTVSQGTVTYDASFAQSIIAATYANLATGGTGNKDLTGTTTVTATLTAGGTSTFRTNGQTLNIQSTSTVAGGGAFNFTSGTVNYSGSAAQDIFSTTYQNITFSGSGAKTALADLTITGNVLIEGNATFAAGTFTHTVQGNWNELTVAAAMTGNSTILFSGGGTSAIGNVSPVLANLNTIRFFNVQLAPGKVITFNSDIADYPVNGDIIVPPCGSTAVTMTGSPSSAQITLSANKSLAGGPISIGNIGINLFQLYVYNGTDLTGTTNIFFPGMLGLPARTLYWVGGTGNWDDCNRWSLTSGGAGGQAAPLISDDVFFDDNSFTAAGQVVTVTSGATCQNMTWGPTVSNDPTLALGANNIALSGSLSLSSNPMSVTSSGGALRFIVNPVLPLVTRTITSNGKPVPNVIFDGTGGVWSLTDNLSSTGSITVTNGHLNNANNVNISASSIAVAAAGNLTGGAATITLTGGGTPLDLATGATTSLTNTTFSFTTAASRAISLGNTARTIGTIDVATGALTINDNNAAQVINNVILAGLTTLTDNHTTGATTFGAITGGNSVVFAANGANTYNGAITFGTDADIDFNGADHTFTVGAPVVIGGGTLDILTGGAMTFANNWTLTNVTGNVGGDRTFGGNWSVTGGTLTFAGNNIFNGQLIGTGLVIFTGTGTSTLSNLINLTGAGELRLNGVGSTIQFTMTITITIVTFTINQVCTVLFSDAGIDNITTLNMNASADVRFSPTGSAAIGNVVFVALDPCATLPTPASRPIFSGNGGVAPVAFGTAQNWQLVRAQNLNVTSANLTIAAQPIASYNLGGNTGITFNQFTRIFYWTANGGTGNGDWAYATTPAAGTGAWSFSSGGAAVSCYPTQVVDSVVFDNNSFTAAAQTVTVNTGATAPGASGIRMNVTGTAGHNLAVNNPLSLAGSLNMANTNMNISGTNTLTFTAATRNSATRHEQIITAGNTIGANIAINAITPASNQFRPTGALTIAANRSLTLTAGIFQTNNETLSTGALIASGTGTRTLTLGTTDPTISGTGTAVDLTGTGLTLNVSAANDFTFSDNTASATTTVNWPDQAAFTFGNMNFTGTAAGRTINFVDGTRNHVFGALTVAQGATFNESGTGNNTFGAVALGTTGNVNNVTFTGANTYNSTVSVNAAATNTVAFSTAGSSAFNGNVSLNANNTASTYNFNSATFAVGAALTAGDNTTSTFSGTNAYRNITYGGAANMTFNGTNAFNSPVTVGSTTTNSTVTVNGGTYAAASNWNISNQSTAATTTFNGSNTFNGNMTFTNSGTVSLPGNNTFAGASLTGTGDATFNFSNTGVTTVNAQTNIAGTVNITGTSGTVNFASTLVNTLNAINLNAVASLFFSNAGADNVTSISLDATAMASGSTAVQFSHTGTAVVGNMVLPSASGCNVTFTPANRPLISSRQAGTQASVSFGSAQSWQALRVRDLNVTSANVSVAGSPTSAYNLGNNTGITFTTLIRTFFWVRNGGAGNGNWSYTTAPSSGIGGWAFTSGGAVVNCYPSSVTDSVIFDNNSFNANNQTVQVNNLGGGDPAPAASGINTTAGVTNTGHALRVNSGVTLTVGGSLNMNSPQLFLTAQDLTSTVLMTGGTRNTTQLELIRTVFSTTVASPNFTLTAVTPAANRWQLVNAFTMDDVQASSFTLTSGALLTNNQNMDVGRLIASGTGVRALNMGTSDFTIREGATATILDLSGANLTLTSSSDNDFTILGGATSTTQTVNWPTVSAATFGNVNFSGTNARTITFADGGQNHTYGALTVASAATFNESGAGNNTFTGVVTLGSGTNRLNGATFTGANTFQQNVIVRLNNASPASFGANSSFQQDITLNGNNATASYTFGTGTTFANATDVTMDNGSLTINTGSTFNNSNWTISNATATATINGNNTIGGEMNFVTSGIVVTFTGNNSFTNTTAANALRGAATVNFNGTGTTTVSAQTNLTGPLNLGGSGATVTFASASNNVLGAVNVNQPTTLQFTNAGTDQTGALTLATAAMTAGTSVLFSPGVTATVASLVVPGITGCNDAPANRPLIASSTSGSQANLSLTTAATLFSVRIRDLNVTTNNLTVNASPTTDADLLNNTGVTFINLRRTFFWVRNGGGGGGNWSYTTAPSSGTGAWSFTSGGAVVNCYPSAVGDSVIFDANSINTGVAAQTITVNVLGGANPNPATGGLRTTTINAASSGQHQLLISNSANALTIGGALQMTDGDLLLTAAGSNSTVTMTAAKRNGSGEDLIQIQTSATVASPNLTLTATTPANNKWETTGALTLRSTTTISPALTLTSGTFTTNNQALSVGRLIASGSAVRTLNLGTTDPFITGGIASATTTVMDLSGTNLTMDVTNVNDFNFNSNIASAPITINMPDQADYSFGHLNFSANPATRNITLNDGNRAHSLAQLTVAGGSGTFTKAGGGNYTVVGNATFGSGAAIGAVSLAGNNTFNGTFGGTVNTINGLTTTGDNTFNGAVTLRMAASSTSNLNGTATFNAAVNSLNPNNVASTINFNRAVTFGAGANLSIGNGGTVNFGDGTTAGTNTYANTLNNVTAGTSTVRFHNNGNNTFGTINLSATTTASTTWRFSRGGTSTVANLTMPIQCGNVDVVINSADNPGGAGAAVVNFAAVQNWQNADVTRINASGGSRVNVYGSTSTDGTGNTNVFFDASGAAQDQRDLYWVDNSGTTSTWNNTSGSSANWSLSPGGPNGACPPDDNDNVFFNDASFTASGRTVTIGVGAICRNITWVNDVPLADAPVMAFGTNNVAVYRDIFLQTPAANWDMTATNGSAGTAGGGGFEMRGTTTGRTIQTNGENVPNLRFNGVGGEWSLQDALVVDGTAAGRGGIFLENGSLLTNGQDITAGYFTANIGTGVRSLTISDETTLTLTGTTTSAVGATGVNVTSTVFDLRGTNFTYNTPGTVNTGLVFTNATGNNTDAITVQVGNTATARELPAILFDGDNVRNIDITTEARNGAGTNDVTFRTITRTSPTNTAFEIFIAGTSDKLYSGNIDFAGGNMSNASAANQSYFEGANNIFNGTVVFGNTVRAAGDVFRFMGNNTFNQTVTFGTNNFIDYTNNPVSTATNNIFAAAVTAGTGSTIRMNPAATVATQATFQSTLTLNGNAAIQLANNATQPGMYNFEDDVTVGAGGTIAVGPNSAVATTATFANTAPVTFGMNGILTGTAGTVVTFNSTLTMDNFAAVGLMGTNNFNLNQAATNAPAALPAYGIEPTIASTVFYPTNAPYQFGENSTITLGSGTNTTTIRGEMYVIGNEGTDAALTIPRGTFNTVGRVMMPAAENGRIVLGDRVYGNLQTTGTSAQNFYRSVFANAQAVINFGDPAVAIPASITNTIQDLRLSRFNIVRLSPGGSLLVTGVQDATTGEGGFTARVGCDNWLVVNSLRPGTQAPLTFANNHRWESVIIQDLQVIDNVAGVDLRDDIGVNIGNNTTIDVATPTTGTPAGAVTIWMPSDLVRSSRNFFWIGNAGTDNPNTLAVETNDMSWSNPNNWSLSSGGTATGCIPNPTDNVIYDVNSFSADDQFCDVDLDIAYCNSMEWVDTNAPFNTYVTTHSTVTLNAGSAMDFRGRLRNQNVPFNQVNLTPRIQLYGNFTGGANWANDYTGVINFIAQDSTSRIIRQDYTNSGANGNPFLGPLIFDTNRGTNANAATIGNANYRSWYLASNLHVDGGANGDITVNSGRLRALSYTINLNGDFTVDNRLQAAVVADEPTNAGFSAGTSTVIFDGTNNSNVTVRDNNTTSGTPATGTIVSTDNPFYNLTINKASRNQTVTLDLYQIHIGNNVDHPATASTNADQGTLTITSGNLVDNGQQIWGNSNLNSELIMGSQGILTIGSAGTATLFPTRFRSDRLNLDCVSTVIYNSGVAQSVRRLASATATRNYGNLFIRNGSNKTLAVGDANYPTTDDGTNRNLFCDTLSIGATNNCFLVDNGYQLENPNGTGHVIVENLATGSNGLRLGAAAVVAGSPGVHTEFPLNVPDANVEFRGTANLVEYRAGIGTSTWQRVRGFTTGDARYQNLTITNFTGSGMANKLLMQAAVVRGAFVMNGNNTFWDNGNQLDGVVKSDDNSYFTIAGNSILQLGNATTATELPRFLRNTNFDLANTSTVVYRSGVAQTVRILANIGTANDNYPNLIIRNAGIKTIGVPNGTVNSGTSAPAAFTADNSLRAIGIITIDSAATFHDNGYQIVNMQADNNNQGVGLIMAANTTLRIGGPNGLQASRFPRNVGDNVHLDASSTVIYEATTAQNVRRLADNNTGTATIAGITGASRQNRNYGNLIIRGNSVKTIEATTGTNGQAMRPPDDGGTTDNASNTFRVRGNLTIDNQATLFDNGFQILPGTGAITGALLTPTYPAATTGVLTMTAGTNLRLANRTLSGAGGTNTSTYFPPNFTSANLNLDCASTVTYEASIAQAVRRLASATATRNYGNLTTTGGAQKTLLISPATDDATNTLKMCGTLTVSTASTELWDNGYQLEFIGAGTALEQRRVVMNNTSNILRLGTATTATLFPSNYNTVDLSLPSTIIYNAGDVQTVQGLATAGTVGTAGYISGYANLTLRNTNGTPDAQTNGVKNLNALTNVNGAISIETQTQWFDQGFQVTHAASQNFTMAANAFLTLGTSTSATTFPLNTSNANINFDAASTQIYRAGNGLTQTVRRLASGTAAQNYGNLIIRNISAAPSLTNTVKSIESGTTTVDGTFFLRLQGNLTVEAFNDFRDGGIQISRTASGGTLTVQNNSILTLGSNSITSQVGLTQLPLNYPRTNTNIVLATSTGATNDASTVIYQAGPAVTVYGGQAPAATELQYIAGNRTGNGLRYGNLIINSVAPGSGTAFKAAVGRVEVADDLTIGDNTYLRDCGWQFTGNTTAGRVFTMGANAYMQIGMVWGFYDEVGNVSQTGRWYGANGNNQGGPDNTRPSVFPLNFEAAGKYILAPTSSIDYAAHGHQRVIGNMTYANLVLSNPNNCGGGINCTRYRDLIAGPVSINGNLTVQNNIRFRDNSHQISMTNTGTLTLEANAHLVLGGTLPNASSPGGYNAVGAEDRTDPSVLSNDLQWNATDIPTASLGSPATPTVFPLNVLDANLNLDANSWVTYNASVAQNIRALQSGTANRNYGNLKVVKGTGTATPTAGIITKNLLGATTVRGQIRIEQQNNLVDNGFQLTHAANQTLLMQASTQLTLGNGAAATQFPLNTSSNSVHFNANSTVVYQSTANQPVRRLASNDHTANPERDYANLTIIGAGTSLKTLAATNAPTVPAVSDADTDNTYVRGLLTFNDARMSLNDFRITMAGNLERVNGNAFETFTGSNNSKMTILGTGNLANGSAAKNALHFTNPTQTQLSDFVLNRTSSGLATLGTDLIVGTVDDGDNVPETGEHNGSANMANGTLVLNQRQLTYNTRHQVYQHAATAFYTGDYAARMIVNGLGDFGSASNDIRFTTGSERLQRLIVNRFADVANANADNARLATSLNIGDPAIAPTAGTELTLTDGDLELVGNVTLTLNSDHRRTTGRIRSNNSAILTLANATAGAATYDPFVFEYDAGDASVYSLANLNVMRPQEITVASDLRVMTNLQIAQNAIVQLPSSTNLVAQPVTPTRTLTLEGTLTLGGAGATSGNMRGSYTSGLVINGTGDLVGDLTFTNNTDANRLERLTINRTATGVVTLAATNDLNIGVPDDGDGTPETGEHTGQLTMSNGTFELNNRTLTFNSLADQYTRTNGTFTGSATSNMILNGPGHLRGADYGAFQPIVFANSTSFPATGQQLNNFTVNRIGTVSANNAAALGSSLRVNGNLALQDGTLALSDNAAHTFTIAGTLTRSDANPYEVPLVNLNEAGILRANSNANLTITNDNSAQIRLFFDESNSVRRTVRDFTNNRVFDGTTGDVVLRTELRVDGTMTLGTGSLLDLEVNRTGAASGASRGLLIFGPLTGDGELEGSYTEDLMVSGNFNRTLRFRNIDNANNGRRLRSFIHFDGIATTTLASDLTIGDPAAPADAWIDLDQNNVAANGTLNINGNILTINSGVNDFNADLGSFAGSNTSDLIINGLGNFGSNVRFIAGARSLRNFRVNRSLASGDDNVLLGTDLTTVTGGTTELTDGDLGINGNTLTINGVYTRGDGRFIGSTTSDLVIGGNGAAAELVFDNSSLPASQTLENLTISRTVAQEGSGNGIQMGSDLIVGIAGASSGLDLTGVDVVLAINGTAGSPKRLTLNGQLTESAGTISGTANSAMTIGGGSAALNGSVKFTNGSRLLGNLTMSRSNPTATTSTATLGTPLVLTGTNALGTDELILTNGRLTTSSSALLTLDETAVVQGASQGINYTGNSGGSNNSHIDGPISKRFGAALTGSNQIYRFPIGKLGRHRPSGVADFFNYSAGTEFGSEFFPSIPPTFWDLDLTDLRYVSKVEHWAVTRYASAAEPRVLLSWDALSDVGPTAADWDELRVANRRGPGFSTWFSEGRVARDPAATQTNGYIVSNLRFNTFNFATLANRNGANILPVSLLSWTAEYDQNEDAALLRWKTSNERAVKGYVLSRSIDNTENFEEIASHRTRRALEAKGNGQPGTQTYQLYDYEFQKDGQINYYRLQMEDIAGELTTFEIKAVRIGGGLLLFQNYPNPTNGPTTMSFSLPEQMSVRLEVIDMLGRVVDVITEGTMNAGSYQYEYDSKPLQSGTYVIRLVAGDTMLTKKMSVIK